MGIRDNEVRAKSLGYSTWLRRFLAFLLSGFFAGVAGVLYVYYRMAHLTPDAGIDVSGLVIMMVIIGGVGTLWGGALGALLILFLSVLHQPVCAGAMAADRGASLHRGRVLRR